MNNSAKILLYPFAIIYGIITFIRNLLYDWKLLPEKKFDVHTIGVGNLAVGGAGKTPMVEYLIRLLRKHNYQLATLSRGYKRKTSGYVLADEHSSAEDIGDEPLLYKSKYGIPVAVDASRVNGVKNLTKYKELSPHVILLDDVFQHRSIKCGLNIVVTDFHNIFYKDHMLPAGTLREFKRGMNRADIIVVTKTPDNTSPIEIRNMSKDVNPKAHQHVFFSYLKYGELYQINKPKETLDTLKDLYRYRIISFAGIANADTMVNYLKEYAAEVRHIQFADHYEYSPKDLSDIERYYHSFEGGNKILVTTEKDLMRLRNKAVWKLASSLNIYILPVEVTFKEKEEEFNGLILKYARSTSINHGRYS